MQVHGPSESLHDESGIRVGLNPGSSGPFADITIGHVELFIREPEECDWIIKAAVEAKRLLLGEPAANAPRRAGDELPCAAVHADPGAGMICNSQNGHDGPDHVAWAADGREIARWGADVTPDPDACTCGHLAVRHVYGGKSPCAGCGCEEFSAAVLPEESRS